MIKKIIRWLLVLIIITGITFLGFYNFWFLRLPERNIPFLDKVYVSPANGKVIAIKPWYQDSLVITKGMLGAIKILTEDLGKQGKMLSIEMNLQNVHYRRAPIRGKVLNRYTPGVNSIMRWYRLMNMGCALKMNITPFFLRVTPVRNSK